MSKAKYQDLHIFGQPRHNLARYTSMYKVQILNGYRIMQANNIVLLGTKEFCIVLLI